MLNTAPETMSLKRRVLDAGLWSITGFALNYAIRLGSSLLMTRLLIPQMFGVMAIAMMVMAGLAMFSDLGLQQNIIQSRRGGDPDYLNTAWTIQIIRGALLWILALCISMLVFAANHVGLVPKTSAYADPYLPYVIAVISISVVINGLQSTKLSEASRNLWLGRITLLQIAAQIIGLICMVTWAWISHSIWALVAGNICSAASTALLSHILLPGVTNRWRWERSAAHEIIHFGKWIFLSSILGFFANNADRMLLGGYVDSATLGIYSIAFTVFSMVTQILTTIFAQVSFPALSEVVRERVLELKRNLYRFHLLTASFAYFCAGGLFVSGTTLIGLLYDRRYQQAGWMLEVLSIALLSVPFNLAHNALLARGLPRIFTNVIAVRVLATFVLIPLGFHFFSFPGALWGIVLSQLSSVPAVLYYQARYHLFDLAKELYALPALLVGMLLGKGFTLLMGQPF
jgi:O-antigen/teichoic acid export membrane protein